MTVNLKTRLSVAANRCRSTIFSVFILLLLISFTPIGRELWPNLVNNTHVVIGRRP